MREEEEQRLQQIQEEENEEEEELVEGDKEKEDESSEKTPLPEESIVEPVKEKGPYHVYSRPELLDWIQETVESEFDGPASKDGRYTVGMVGYPNVGKSSVINVISHKIKVKYLINFFRSALLRNQEKQSISRL